MQRDRIGSAGAMTLAMKAVAADEGRRVLRVGWIEGSQLREERIFRDPTEVSVGRHERSTFVSGSVQSPAHFKMFVPEGDGYRLYFSDAMDGRIVRSEGVVSLTSLAQSGRARRERDGWSIPLDVQSRGKIQVGDAALLFQFVPPPPPATRPQLPVAIRQRPLARADWTYNACLAGFLLLAFGAVSYVEYGYDPVVEDSPEEAANVVRLVMPTVDEPPPPPAEATNTDPTAAPATDPRQATNATPATNESHSASGARGSARPASHASQADIDRQTLAMADRIAGRTMSGLQRSMTFNPLLGMPEPGRGMLDTIAQGAEMNQTAQDLANAGGIDNVNHGIVRNSLVASANVGRRDLGRPEPIVSNGPAVNTGNDQQIVMRIPPRIQIEQPLTPNPVPELPSDDVASVVRHNLGGLQWCYTQGLRNQPSLSGRVEVEFSIGASGRIVGTPEVHGFDEAPDVQQCLQGRFRSMVFPQPHGGTAEFTFPFNFVPGSH